MSKRDRSPPTDAGPPPLTLIDGYNLIHAVGVGGRIAGRGGLERARAALISALAELLPGEEAARTVVVFDAERPPPGLPRTLVAQGITVHFAADHEDADALLEELIARHSAPRSLTVVSSDHRLQRAARRRKARAVDSEAWYDEQLRKRQERGRVLVTPAKRPEEPPADETEYWLRQFGATTGDDAIDDAIDDPSPPAARRGRQSQPKPDAKRPARRRSAKQRRVPSADELADPFPPGYGDDVWEEEEEQGRGEKRDEE
jgi:predicted RNA-binding protein with PIN domain